MKDVRTGERTAARAVGKAKKPVKRGRPGRPTLVELERRKGEIMRVAAAQFIAEGYTATTLVDIAKRAGVATRTLYQHYGDKEALFKEVMFSRDSAAIYPFPELDPSASLFEILSLAADYACDIPFRASTVEVMRLAISESQRFPEMTGKLMNRTQAQFDANIRQAFDELTRRGIVEDPDTAASARMFINLIQGNLVLLFAGWRSSGPTREELDQRVELFIQGRWGPAVLKRARRPVKVSKRMR